MFFNTYFFLFTDIGNLFRNVLVIYQVLSIPDKRLYQVSDLVDVFDRTFRTLVRDLFDTMYHLKGVGLAAVQVAILKRVLVIDLEDAGFVKGVFVNPKVIASGEDMDLGEEGCLSVPGISSMLARPTWVDVEYQNIFGEVETIHAEKLMARALLHEIDHLDGKVYIDLLESQFRQEIDSDVKRLIEGKSVLNPRDPSYRSVKV